MRTSLPTNASSTRSHRPRAITVFAAAFVAGAAAAVGVNRTLDVRMAQSKPRVESEAIFVALRSLPQGSPVTVWDVALRDWPKAMLPATALRASDTFSGHVLKHPLREGQPLLSIQLAPSGQGAQPGTEPTPFAPPAYTQSAAPATDADLWSTPVALPPQHAAKPATPAPQATVPVQDAVTPQDIAPPSQPIAVQEVVPSTEQAAVPPAASIAVTTDQPTPTDAATPAGTVATDTTPSTESGATETKEPTPEQVATTTPTVVEPTVEAITAPDPQQGPTPAVGDVSVESPAPETATPTDTPTPVATPDIVAAPEPAGIAAPMPFASSPPAAGDRPRPAHSRFLVVPERIAAQADASFAARAATQQTGSNAQPATGRPASGAVQPLPSTATAERRPQGRQPANSPQGRQPQRQGRQTAPATNGAANGTTPQPRFGTAMFPNVSAGIEALEQRMRGDAASQGGTPTAAQARPVTAR